MTQHWTHWMTGRLSSGERAFSALAPVLLLIAYFAVAAVFYGIRNRSNGRFRDEEISARGSAGFTSLGLRHFFAWTMRPLCRLLARVQFPPNAVTLLSLVLALGASVAVAAGRFALGGWLFVLAGILDFIDGRLARSTGRCSAGGAALDSVLDRYVECALIAGLCWYYRESWVLAAGLLALTGSLLVPYVRARGEALGVCMTDTGYMQRPERVLLLGAGTALSPILEVLINPADPHPPHTLAIATVVLLGIGSHLTAIQRLVLLMRRLRAPSSASSARGTAAKSALSNGLATAVDFAIATLLFHGLWIHPAAATAVGCVAGSLLSFALARGWAFGASAGQLLPQVARYAVVSVLTLALNTGGVALLLLLPLPFVPAWCLARSVVFLLWSHPSQRDFVFVAQQRPLTRSSNGRPSARPSVDGAAVPGPSNVLVAESSGASHS